MRAIFVLALLGASILPASAENACSFVDVEDPTFAVSFEPGAKPVVSIDGKAEKWESESLGAGVMARRAIDPSNPDGAGYVFAIHEYDGKSFLVFGSQLLAETCGG